MKADVHIFALVRVTVQGVRAATPVEAAKQAQAQTNLRRFFQRLGPNVGFADVENYRVDTVDDEGHTTDVIILDGEFNPK